jgi:hypothetical protein
MAVRPPTPSNNNNDTASVAIVTTTSHPSEVLQAPIESNSNNNSSATNIALASHASTTSTTTTSTTTIASIGTDSSMEVGPSRTASRGGASRWRPSLYSFGMHCNQCAINNNMEESQRIVYEEGFKDSLLS